jgi:hypothetical protein
MADLSITAANVIAGAGATIVDMMAGATLTAGQVVYRSETDGLARLADNNGASANIRTPFGIALNGAASGQPVRVLTQGPITIGAAVASGLAYYLSATPGGICPVGDLSTGNYVSLIGATTSSTVLFVQILPTGVLL